MSAAATAAQAAAVQALSAHPGISAMATGVFDGPPPGQPLPYLVIGDGETGDWSTKTSAGREVRLVIGIIDDGERPARLHGLLGDSEDAVTGMTRSIDGWRVASIVLLRSRIVRAATGRWLGSAEFRIRMMEE